jgi:ubiquinone/menaquinone biosynthesis C-methylase UbiE
MTTHQQLTGSSDERFVQTMVNSHDRRFGDGYWARFADHVQPRLPAAPVVVGLGCGPGLILRDIAKRMPGATLCGFDLTPAMIDYARGLDYGGCTATLEVLDLVQHPLPLADGSVDLVTMNVTLHLFEDPFTFLAGVCRVLKPAGTFALFDFVRSLSPITWGAAAPWTRARTRSRSGAAAWRCLPLTTSTPLTIGGGC